MKADTKEVRNGLVFKVQVPESAAEFDSLAGENGAHLAEANDNIWYRGVLPDCWYWLAAALLHTHKDLPRKVKAHPEGKKYTEGDKKGQVIMVAGESDPQYVDRVIAAKYETQAAGVAAIQSLADEICNMVGPKTNLYGTNTNLADGDRLISFNPKSRPRGSGPAIPKSDLEAAKQFIAQGPKGLGVTLKKLEQALNRKIELPKKDDPNHDAELVKVVAIAFRDFRQAESQKLAKSLAA